jgi:hypothetical protein
MLKYLLIIFFISSVIYSQPSNGSEYTLQDTLFSDHFESLNNWTIVGPFRNDELVLFKIHPIQEGLHHLNLFLAGHPLFIGDSYILSPVISTELLIILLN